jgi:hypothetical protein
VRQGFSRSVELYWSEILVVQFNQHEGEATTWVDLTGDICSLGDDRLENGASARGQQSTTEGYRRCESVKKTLDYLLSEAASSSSSHGLNFDLRGRNVGNQEGR